jgi:NAD(P)-dependent dehydrogenase (short-subunit alcohol dehydrogenase family)
MTPTRHVLVTGAARGIGAATALRFLRDGYRVTGLVRSLGTVEIDTNAMQIVVGDLAEMDRAGFVAEHGPFDVLVNNAAHHPSTLLESLDLDEYRQILEVNLVAVVDLMALVAESMKQKRWGRVVNVGSITTSVAWSGWADRVAYASSKGGLEVATRVAARSLGAHSITVNTISPGAIPTAAEAADSENELILGMQALPFRGSVDDIASAISFLASDEAKFITGQNINVDGGWVMQ